MGKYSSLHLAIKINLDKLFRFCLLDFFHFIKLPALFWETEDESRDFYSFNLVKWWRKLLAWQPTNLSDVPFLAEAVESLEMYTHVHQAEFIV